MTDLFKLKVDLVRNIPFVLDAILEIGIGIVILSLNASERAMLFLGYGLVFFGLIQFIRKIKTFHLTKNELTIRRPLFPFKIAEENYPLVEIQEVKFNRIKGRFGGPHLNVLSKSKNGDFRIETAKENIDRFEMELKKVGVKTIRIGM